MLEIQGFVFGLQLLLLSHVLDVRPSRTSARRSPGGASLTSVSEMIGHLMSSDDASSLGAREDFFCEPPSRAVLHWL